jgi:hypothetical protein
LTVHAADTHLLGVDILIVRWRAHQRIVTSRVTSPEFTANRLALVLAGRTEAFVVAAAGSATTGQRPAGRTLKICSTIVETVVRAQPITTVVQTTNRKRIRAPANDLDKLILRNVWTTRANNKGNQYTG